MGCGYALQIITLAGDKTFALRYLNVGFIATNGSWFYNTRIRYLQNTLMLLKI